MRSSTEVMNPTSVEPVDVAVDVAGGVVFAGVASVGAADGRSARGAIAEAVYLVGAGGGLRFVNARLEMRVTVGEGEVLAL